MPAITLDEGARALLESYHWRGNIRQLKNVAEQISAVEQSRTITSDILRRYLPSESYSMRIAGEQRNDMGDMATERELLYKILFDMRSDINDLKRMMREAMAEVSTPSFSTPTPHRADVVGLLPEPREMVHERYDYEDDMVEVVDDYSSRELTKEDVQREQIIEALRRNNYRRKDAARDLFISERTLYRRMKTLGIDDNTK
jgi:DNA-binding NtrC family response regulator